MLDLFEYIWTKREEYLVVSVTVQNLVMVEAVIANVSIFGSLAGKRLFTPQKNCGFRDILQYHPI